MRTHYYYRVLSGSILTLGLIIVFILPFVAQEITARQTSIMLAGGDSIDITCETELLGVVGGTQATIACAAPVATVIPASPTAELPAPPPVEVARSITIEAEDALQFNDADDINRGGVYRSDGLDVEACAACDRGAGGYTVGWIVDGEWVEYQTTFVAAGSYQIRLRSAVPNYGRVVDIALNGMSIGAVKLPFTGSYRSYADVDSSPFTAGIGPATIRLHMLNGAFNLDMLQIIPLDQVAPPAQPTSTLVPTIPAQPTSTLVPTATAQPPSIPMPTSTTGNSSQGTAWQRWEQRFQASNTLNDPYHTVQLQANFRGPDGTTFSVNGFWDGDHSFAIRTMFPTAGIWSWDTSSIPADPGLTQSGTVDVSAASQGSVLVTHGRLAIAPSQRYLIHANGTPFFWLGDTAWAAPLQASDEEWAQYLDTRVAQGFSVIQVALAPAWMATSDRQGRTPFFGAGIRQPDPRFWEGLASKVAAANARGLVVLVIGLGDPLDTQNLPGAEEQHFARQLAARLAGDHVILSPSFDRSYQPEMNAVGAALREAVPHALITQHPGTPSGQPNNIWAEQYTTQPYMSLYGNQTGHNGGNRALVNSQAVSWNLSLWRAQITRPVINLEAFYDAHGTAANLGDAYSGTAADVRATGYLSLLSGASGYTYGAFGVWGWERDPQASSYWQKGLAFPSATHMSILRNVFSSVSWWQLVPAPERIANPASGIQIMALASTPDGRLTMAYLPDNPQIAIRLDGLASSLRVTWVNPSTGEQIDGGLVSSTGTVSFARPGNGDWLLLLQAV